jgi:hypothetical protein
LAGRQDRSDTDKAIQPFDAVRDRIKYDPFHVSFSTDDYRASRIVKRVSNFCVPKAVRIAQAL